MALWWMIPTLYFAEGWPYALVNTTTVSMWKQLGVSNVLIGWTSLFQLPWTIKMLWSPLLERGKPHRWVLQTQIGLALLLGFMAYLLPPKAEGMAIVAVLGLCFLIGIVSATHDMAVDGFYIRAFSRQEQEAWVGMRVLAYRLAMIAGSGGILMWVGRLQKSGLSIHQSWVEGLRLAALVMAALAVFHTFCLWRLKAALPREKADTSNPSDLSEAPGFSATSENSRASENSQASENSRASENNHAPGAKPAKPAKLPTFEMSRWAALRAPFESYARLPGIGGILAFLLFYRFGEALLLKMVQPFLLDSKTAGGLAFGTELVGFGYGIVGVIASISGGILGGLGIARWGLSRCLWPMMLAMNLPDLLYVWLALFPMSWEGVVLFLGIEQAGYGLGFSVFTVVLLRISRLSTYETSHFAISTGLMSLGLMLPGILSGWLQQQLGYAAFFFAAFLLSIPGMLVVRWLPQAILDPEKEQGLDP